ncbi:recombinase family protein [Arenivirga flava]|uniref:Recombinase family protein n=1 Tax=Arenivirga flava TaxID=1930060 RepID=A0AA37UEZ2_9MICO|nr:recombinase family protein [Arenivirga flava]GMA26801.1 hypothetical protein GCM10025874_00540 [Arenivirga flava]GMA29917.1 hypothetical protein GCM10025874_31700 [Arenivirga flava]GMA29954.1 hypothetical protein GCM10025874_32070 [Arenivirga flava]
MKLRAAIYARISNKDKRTPKVADQIAILKLFAGECGYTVGPVFQDDGIAASGKSIDDTTLEKRPGAQALLKAMEAKEFDVLLAVEGERLARTYQDGLKFISTSADAGVLWHFEGDRTPLDVSTPNGEETAVAIFTSGRREGRIRDARQRRRYERERAAGMPLWGTRPFGFEPDRITVREEEAAYIRTAVADYLSGTRSMLRIAKDWTAAGVKTDAMRPSEADVEAGRDYRERVSRDGEKRPVSTVWTATTVRQLLLRPRNAGLLVYKGQQLAESKIERIIEPEQHEALKSRVKAGTPVSERAVTLLGGVLRCECGAVMHGTTSYSQRNKERGNVPAGKRYVFKNYKCSKALYDKSQRHASIAQGAVDDFFTATLLADLFHDRIKAPGDDVSAKLSDLAQRLIENQENVKHVGAQLLDPALKSIHAQGKSNLAALDSEREELEAERDRLLSRAADGGALSGFLDEWRRSDDAPFKDTEEREAWEARLREAWGSLPIDRQRAMIRARYRPSVKVGGRGISRLSLGQLPGGDYMGFDNPVSFEPEPEGWAAIS